MDIGRSELNRKIIKELRKDPNFKLKTYRDGQIVMNAITKTFKKTLLSANILSLGFCWLYPKKNEVFRKRNLIQKLIRKSILKNS